MEDGDSQLPKKPIAYLDQNILDLFVEGEHQDFLEKLRSNFVVAYSDETLKEIKRSGDYSSKFLSVLQQLDAYHLKLVLEQPEFKETDQATLAKRDPNEAFEEYCQSDAEYDEIQKSMEKWLFKHSGGNKGVGISEIHEEQKRAFAGLMGEMKEQLEELSDEVPDIDIERMFDEYQKEMTLNLTNALDKTERLMKENIKDDLNWTGIKEFREANGIGPKELNNIKPPSVVKQIWEMYRVLPPYKEMDIDINKFLGFAENNPIFPDSPYFKHQKAFGIYNLLNSLGYWPDSKVHKERRFVAAMSDNNHASMASFCHVLFSRDEAFVKKVQAAYEYLEIPTAVQFVVVKNA